MKRKIGIYNVINKKIKCYKSNTNIIKNIDLGIWSGLNELIYPNDIKIDDKKDWISPSNIKNFALEDPLIDWLHYYKKYNLTKSKSNDELKQILNCGNDFEKSIYTTLQKKYPNDIYIFNSKFPSKDLYEVTKKKISEKTPIICQAVLYNEINKTFGVADMLVRNDWIEKIFINEKINCNDYNKHLYCVIDIKWSRINFCVDNVHVRNINMMAATKCQLALYNLALGIIQGHINNKAYIMCKNWINDNDNDKNSKNNNNCFYKLGHVDYSGFDNKYLDIARNGIYWIRDMRYNGMNWSCYPPTVPNLYPNMCNKYDTEYREQKMAIAKENNELTLLWMVGPKNRRIAHKNGIYSYKNPKCCAKSLGVYGEKLPKILDEIIKINKDETPELILPKTIKNNYNNWKKMTINDIYLDFETINTCFISNKVDCNITEKTDTTLIYLIGVGYLKNKKFIYKSFVANKLDNKSEKKILKCAINFINSKMHNNMTPKIFHWGSAEEHIINNANNKHGQIFSNWINNIKWIDMCRIFRNEPIVIKGALNFGLKEIGHAMYNNKQINKIWTDNDINGLNSMTKTVDCYNNNNKDITPIIEYNKMDCEILYEIVKYLRAN